MKLGIAALPFALVLFGISTGLCQSPADPLRTLLAEAVQSSSLQSEGTPAFHMEARYETYDYLGEPLGSGTVAADFLKPGFYKVSVHDGGSADRYAPEDQEKIGIEAPPNGNFMQRLVVYLFFHPGPTKDELETGKLKEKSLKLGTVQLRCVSIQGSKPESKFIGQTQTYCLSSEPALIRIAQQRYGLETVYNNFVRFGEHTFGKEVTIQQRGKVRARLSVTKFVAAPALKEADFPKGQDAPGRLDQGMVKIAADVQKGQNVSKVQPVYPMEDKANHVSGSVFLHAVIGKDGSVEDLEIISAPSPTMAQSAVDAVSQWKYTPYLLNGRPTEVDTTITVNYSFGR